MSWGRFCRICDTALRTSFVARSVFVPKTKVIVVVELPSVTVDRSSSMLPKLAIASSIFLVTWNSSSAGPAPGCVTVTRTVGTSILGLISIPKELNENQPTRVKIKNKTIVGTGFLIDQAEILKDIDFS